jgi:hypothetical protein
MREAPVVLSARRSFSRFVPLMLCFALLAAGGSSAAVSSPGRAVGSLSLNAGLILTSTSIPGCTPPPTADMCGVRTLSGTLRGLGKVTGAYSYLTKNGPPVCPGILWRAVAHPIHLSVASKGDLEVAVAEATACVDESSGRIQPQTFMITGGTGIFAGASGSGTLQRTLGNDTCDATSCHRNGVETWAGTLIVPGLEFDVSAPTFSGAASKTVRAKRGAKSARVTYQVTARDDGDGTVPAACAPKSGSRFPIGRTTVRCEATDSSANSGTARFTVTVKRPG